MEQSSLPLSSNQAESIQVAATAQARASQLSADADAAAKGSAMWQDLLSFHQKAWWFHLRALFEREADFFRRLRESKASVI